MSSRDSGGGYSEYLGRKQRQEDQMSPSAAVAAAALFDKSLSVLDNGPGLPPLWHWFYFWSNAFQSELGPEGHEKLGSFLPKVPLPRRMYAGGSCEFIEPIRLGSPAEKESTIVDIVEKQGSSGPLVFVTVEHRISQSGVVKSIETQNIVYRGESREGSGRNPAELFEEVPEFPGRIHYEPCDAPSIESDWRRSGSLRAETPLLFRFSALTYNAHKIHYDPVWSLGREGYPGLVVHGPLLALSLVECMRQDSNWPSVRSFEFRSIAPAFAGQVIDLNAQKMKDSNQVSLSAGVGDTTVMKASAVLDLDP